MERPRLLCASRKQARSIDLWCCRGASFDWLVGWHFPGFPHRHATVYNIWRGRYFETKQTSYCSNFHHGCDFYLTFHRDVDALRRGAACVLMTTVKLKTAILHSSLQPVTHLPSAVGALKILPSWVGSACASFIHLQPFRASVWQPGWLLLPHLSLWDHNNCIAMAPLRAEARIDICPF